MSKHHQQIIYNNQQVYTDPNSIQEVSYGTYQATNYTQPQKKKSKEIVYQQQYIAQPQKKKSKEIVYQEQYITDPQYIMEGATYDINDPNIQYVQEGEYVTQDNQNLVYEYQPQEGQVITGYDQQITYEQQQPMQQVIYTDENGQQYQEVYVTDDQIYQQMQQQEKQQKPAHKEQKGFLCAWE